MPSSSRPPEPWDSFLKELDERLGPSHIRQYQVHLFRDRKLSPGTIQIRTAALRLLFAKTLRRPYLLDEIPFPKRPRKLPTVLSPEEAARLIDTAQSLPLKLPDRAHRLPEGKSRESEG